MKIILNNKQNNDLLYGFTELEQNENGFNNLIIGSYIKYKFFNKIKSGGFLVMIKSSPIKKLKDLNKLVLKLNNYYYELSFNKYIFYQKLKNENINKSIFSSKEERNEIIKKGKERLNIILSQNNNCYYDKINDIEHNVKLLLNFKI